MTTKRMTRRQLKEMILKEISASTSNRAERIMMQSHADIDIAGIAQNVVDALAAEYSVLEAAFEENELVDEIQQKLNAALHDAIAEMIESAIGATGGEWAYPEE